VQNKQNKNKVHGYLTLINHVHLKVNDYSRSFPRIGFDKRAGLHEKKKLMFLRYIPNTL
jgi:hypothetical protein